MVEFDEGSPVAFGDEAHMHLAALGRVRLGLPIEVDVPAEDDFGRRVEDQDGRPAALGPVHAAIDDVPTDVWLEDHLGEGLSQEVLVGIPPCADVVREERERTLDRGVDDDGSPGSGGRVGGQGASLVAVCSDALDCSTAALKASSERCQNDSK